jgi:NADH-quinone oxidoreductase subunit M
VEARSALKMQVPFLLLQVILLPIFGAIVAAFAGKKLGKRTGWLAFAVLAYTTLLLLIEAFNLWGNPSTPIPEEYNWATTILNLKFGFQADGLSLPFAIIIGLVVTAISIYSIRYMENRIEQLYGKESGGMHGIYYAVYMLFATGLYGIALSTNLIELYVFVELVLVPSYFMIDLFGYVDRHRIAIMYFIWNHIGAALFLIGIVIAYSATTPHSFEINALNALTGTSTGFWVCLFILVGWLIKMAVFGVHVWLPYGHGEKPTSFAAVVAPIVGSGGYVITRVLFGQLNSSFQIFSLPLMILALITIIYGAFLTMGQDDIKRLYACSTIGQTAYTLIGIASLSTIGAMGGIFYFLSHILGKCILFSVAGILLTQTGIRSIKDLRGLARKMPITATLCIIGSMILSAMPPLSGFQGEWMLFAGVFKQGIQGSSVTLVVAVIGIFATFLTAVYTFWPAVRIFFGELPKSLENVKEAPPSMTAPLLALAVTSFVIGIFPDLITHFLNAFYALIP